MFPGFSNTTVGGQSVIIDLLIYASALAFVN